MPHLHQWQSSLDAYPAVNLHVDGVKVTVGSADIDELDQGSNADTLWRREPSHVMIRLNCKKENNLTDSSH